VVGPIARGGEIDGSQPAARQLRKLRRQGLVVGEAFAEHEGVAQEDIAVGARGCGRRCARLVGEDRVGVVKDFLAVIGLAHVDLGVRPGPVAQHRIGHQPVLGIGGAHDAGAHRLGREQAGHEIGADQADGERRHHERSGARAVAAQHDDAGEAQDGDDAEHDPGHLIKPPSPPPRARA
jgi:hypothetical protein